MNDDVFAERLRALRPGQLPPELLGRLAVPPPTEGRNRRPLIWLGIGAAAAAILLLTLLTAPETTASSVAPILATSTTQRVTEVRPLSVVNESGRAWRLVEVAWVEEDTLVSAAQPGAVQVQDQFRTIVPVAIHFD